MLKCFIGIYYLYPLFLRGLAVEALKQLKQQGGRDLTKHSQILIEKVSVFPRVTPADPCCEVVSQLGIQLVEEFTYLIDFIVVSNIYDSQIANTNSTNILYLIKKRKCEIVSVLLPG